MKSSVEEHRIADVFTAAEVELVGDLQLQGSYPEGSLAVEEDLDAVFDAERAERIPSELKFHVGYHEVHVHEPHAEPSAQ